jgi:hypothetical protein
MYYDEDSYYQGWYDCMQYFGLNEYWDDYDDEYDWYDNLPQTLIP